MMFAQVCSGLRSFYSKIFNMLKTIETYTVGTRHRFDVEFRLKLHHDVHQPKVNVTSTSLISTSEIRRYS